MTPPRVIFFDAAGTLIHLPRGVGHHYSEVAARHGCALDPQAITGAFRSVWKAMPARPSTHTPRPDDDRGWWRTLVGLVLDQLHVPPAQLDRDAYFAELYAEFTRPGVWALYPEVPEVLATLARHSVLGIISNFDGRLRPILADLGLGDTFQHLVISSEVGADKPDPHIFQHALTLADCAPAEAWHVGDDPRCDWAAAASLGLRSFHLQRPHNDLRILLAP